MKYLTLLFVVIFQSLSIAELKLKNSQDQAIFKSTRILASQLLAKNPSDKLGNKLVKFAGWMNGKDPIVKGMKLKLVFQDKVSALTGKASKEELAKQLLEQQKILKEDTSRRLLYISMASELDSQQSMSVMAEFEKFDMSFAKLLKTVKSPELIDTVKEAQKNAETEAENRRLTIVSEGGGKTAMDQILDGVIFPSFSYSESSAVNAINTLTHNLFWRGCQITIVGKRLHYINTTKSAAGALFYNSLLPLPVNETYTLEKKSVRQILQHMASNLKFVWQANKEGVVIYDSKDMSLAKPMASDEKQKIIVTDDGIASKDLQVLMRNMALVDLKKYRGKVLDMNGQITGFGRGFGTEFYVSLDGGKTRLNFNINKANSKIYKRLKARVDKWRSEGGLQAMRDKERELEENYEDVDRATLADPTLFMNFRALCATVERGRLIFKDPQMAFIKSTGEYLVESDEDSSAN